MSYEFHDYTRVFPLLEGADQAALEDSVRQHGVRQPIVLHEGKILDGRNRFLAAHKLGLDIAVLPTRVFDAETEGSALDFVWDANANRRHLNETQRAFAAAEMETLRHGGRRESQEPHAALETKTLTRDELAQRHGIGRGAIYEMSIVRDQGVPELKDVARRGKVSLRTAKTIAELPPAVQQSIIRRSTEGADADCARALRVETAKVKQRGKLADIAKANRALDVADKTYDVIYADPPWQFEEDITGSNRAVERHYPTMSTEEISTLPVDKLAAENSILFCWTTDHHLREAEGVVERWGFKRRARLVWVKNSIGLGKFVRNKHEFLIVGTRGDFPAPPTDCIPESVIMFPKRGHSVKPPLHEMMEKMTPGLTRRIELFAREPVPSWAAWGNQLADGHAGEVMRAPVNSEIVVPSDDGCENALEAESSGAAEHWQM